MRKSIKTDALVLKKKNLLNKDKIVTLFTQELGKIKVFAHGIRKITSRRLPHLETGNLIKIEAYHKLDKFFLQETNLVSGFYKIKNNSKKHKFLYLFLFILDKLLPENQKEDDVFDITKSFLTKLSNIEFNESDLTQYLNKLLLVLGYTDKQLEEERIFRAIEQIIHEKLPDGML